MKPGGRPRIVVTGMSKSVTRLQREQILHVARAYSHDSARLRRLLAEVNREASKSSDSQGWVSPECSSTSLRPDGSMASEFGEEGARAAHQILNGIDIGAQLEDLFRSQGMDPSKMRLVQTASSTATGSRSQGGSGSPPCPFLICTPDTGSGCTIQEIVSTEFEPRSARSVSGSGFVVGSGSPGAGQPDWIPWIWQDGIIKRIGYIGYAVAVSDGPSVIGTDLSDPVAVTGLRWDGGSVHRVKVDCVTPEGLACPNSQFTAMNSGGIAAGFVGAQPAGKGWIHYEAAVLLPDNTIIVAPLPPGTSKTKAVAVNTDGLILVSQEVGWFEQRLFLWSLANRTCQPVDTSSAGNVVPIGIDAAGRILGQARDAANKILSVRRGVDGSWTLLGTPTGYAPAATNSRGDVVGTYKVDGVQRPWLFLSSGELQLLPFVRQHHCHPSDINDSRWIVGAASTDHGSHALLWNPEAGE